MRSEAFSSNMSFFGKKESKLYDDYKLNILSSNVKKVDTKNQLFIRAIYLVIFYLVMTECKEASDGKHIGAVVHQDEEEAAAKIERWKSRVVFENEMQKHGNLFHL